MGDALSSMEHSVPSFPRSNAWFSRSTTVPERRARETGLSNGFRVNSLVILKTSSNRCPPASSKRQPVKDSAIRFMNCTFS